MNPDPYFTSSAEKRFPRYILYLVPGGVLFDQLSLHQYADWLQHGWKSNHEYFPHCTLSGYFLQSPVPVHTNTSESENNPRQEFESALRKSFNLAWEEEQSEFPIPHHPDALPASIDLRFSTQKETNGHSLIVGQSCQERLIRFVNRVSDKLLSRAPKTCFRVKSKLHITLSLGGEEKQSQSQSQSQGPSFPSSWGDWSITMFCQESLTHWRQLSSLTLSQMTEPSAHNNRAETLLKWGCSSFPTISPSLFRKWVKQYAMLSSGVGNDCLMPISEAENSCCSGNAENVDETGKKEVIVINRNYEWVAI